MSRVEGRNKFILLFSSTKMRVLKKFTKIARKPVFKIQFEVGFGKIIEHKINTQIHSIDIG